MANPSIYAAFERMWQHIVLALGGKADKTDIAQSDMSQNDESAPDYVKNKTHWVEENAHVTIYANNALVIDEDEYIGLDLPEPFVVGQEYVITINGTTYNLTVRAHSYWDAFMIGSDQWCGVASENSDGIDSDVPFGAVWYYDGALSVDFFIATGTYDINIGIIRDFYHKLDEGFLPSTIVGKRGSGENAEIFNDYFSNKASGYMSHAEGDYNNASGDYSHTEGTSNKASGSSSHAEGSSNEATGDWSHAEGHNNEASGKGSHVEGIINVASGKASHAEGSVTKANSDYSHAEGNGTIASSESQHVQGKYNVEDATNTYAHIVGNGAYKAPSNAHTLDWSGNAWFAGEIKVGGTGQDDANAKTLATTDDIPTKVSELENDSKFITEDDIPTIDSTISDTSTNSVQNKVIKTYVDTKVAGIVDTAPETLNTLNELAAALGDDPNFATTVANQIGGKVDKVSGKGLSTNDYTTTEKNKLAGIAEGATANTGTITGVSANGTSVATSGVANIPAASTSKYGVTKLSSSTSSTSTSLAATASAVKSAYDLANTANTAASTAKTTADTASSTASAAQTTANAALPKAGGTMTGKLTAQNNTSYTTKQVRNIFLIADGASLPSGSNGDICLVYTP